MNEENKKLAGDQSGHIIGVTVKGKDKDEVLFRLRRSTQFKRLMDAYCNRQSFDLNSVKFLYNGCHVRAEQTPHELNMEDGDAIDTVLIDVSHDLDSGADFNMFSHDMINGSSANDKQVECCSTHLIDGDGTFNATGLDTFMKDVKLGECGISYAVVAIIGPQSSGKSTLLNHLFHTNFKEMDAYKGRSKTTKGIWIARCPGIEPCTIVMDLEGTDGRDKGEDETTFEKQSALFALALSDIVLINMWCHDIGLEQAAIKPLLKTVFQVMLRLICPRKTSLVFVIRDKTRIPLEYLEPALRKDIEKIWDSIPKPEAYKHTLPSEFFNVEVVALSSYEDKEEQFKEQVASLRQKFFQSIPPGGLAAGDRQGVVPASGFSFSAQHIWKIIKENKDLDLAAHNVMVATVVCEEIANEKYSSFSANKDWLELQEAALSQLAPGFGNKLSSLLYNCLSSYDEEAAYFEDGVQYVKRKHLEEKLMQLVQPAYQLMLEHILLEIKKTLSDALNGQVAFAAATRDCVKEFTRLFDEEYAIDHAFWDSANLREQFSCDLNSHIAIIRTAKLSELTSIYESEMKEALYSPVEALLVKNSDDTWPAISNLLHQETAEAVSRFSFAISDFGVEKQEKEDFISNLKNYSRELVEAKAREEAGKVLYHMKERFTSIFKHDDGSMPRVWTGKEDIQATAKTAQYESLKLLSMLAAIRLNEETDTITETLVLTLTDPKQDDSKSTTFNDPLASSTWDEVPATRTLITPVECKYLWNQFRKETECIINQAIASQNMAPVFRKRGREVESMREVVRQLPQIRYRKNTPRPKVEVAIDLDEQPKLKDHPLLQFEPGTEEHTRLMRMIDLQHHQPRMIDWELMEDLGQRVRLEEMVTERWRRVLDAPGRQYHELTLEFFSSFRHTSDHFDNDHAIVFSLGRRLHHMTIPDFAVHLGLYTAEETTLPIFTKSLRGVFNEERPDGVTLAQLKEFWITIADGVYRTSSPESHICDPVIRFLHRIIACTVVGRYMSPEKVSQLDLFILYCLVQKKPANLATIVISSFARQRGRGKGSRIAMGTFIGTLAQSLGVFNDYSRDKLTEGERTARFKFEDMQQMGLCPYGGQRRFVDVQPVDAAEVPVIGVEPPLPRQLRPRENARPATALPVTLEQLHTELVSQRELLERQGMMLQQIVDFFGISTPSQQPHA